MLGKDCSCRSSCYGVGLALASRAASDLAGPLIAFGGCRPLENYMRPRRSSSCCSSAAVGVARRLQLYRRRKSAKQLAEGHQRRGREGRATTPSSCKDKMKDALATLKTASGGKGDYLYDLPWYVIIGPPGAGKTTALVNSGLKFPLVARRDAGGDRRRRRHALLRLVVHRGRGADRHRRPLHDAGFRRQGRQAELALVPRPAQEEPAAPADQRRHRRDQPRRPADAEPGGDRRACRTRSARACSSCTSGSRSISRSMRCSPRPTWSPASWSSSAICGETERKQVWGATFQTADKTRNMIGEVPVEFDALIERLNERPARPPAGRAGADHARRRSSASRRRWRALKQPMLDFLNRDLRADALPRQRDAARLLLHLRHAAGHADRPADRRAVAQLRRRGSRGRRLFGPRQELLPHRPDPQGDHRRGRLGLDRPRRRCGAR